MMRFTLLAVLVQIVYGQDKPYDIDIEVTNQLNSLDLLKTAEEIEGEVDWNAGKTVTYVTPLTEGGANGGLGGTAGFVKELDEDRSIGGGVGFGAGYDTGASHLRGNVNSNANEDIEGGGGTVFNDTFAILGGGFDASKGYGFLIEQPEEGGYETLDTGFGGGLDSFNFNVVDTEEEDGGLFSIRATDGGGGGGIDLFDETISAGGGGGFDAMRAFALPPPGEDLPAGIFKSLSSGGGRGVTIDRENLFIDLGESEGFDGEVTIQDIDALRNWVIDTPAPELKALLLATLP